MFETIGSVYIKEYDTTMDIIKTQYQDGNTAVILNFPDGERFLTLSANIEQSRNLVPWQFFAKEYSENAKYIGRIWNTKLFKLTDIAVKSHFIIFNAWEIIKI